MRLRETMAATGVAGDSLRLTGVVGACALFPAAARRTETFAPSALACRAQGTLDRTQGTAEAPASSSSDAQAVGDQDKQPKFGRRYGIGLGSRPLTTGRSLDKRTILNAVAKQRHC